MRLFKWLVTSLCLLLVLVPVAVAIVYAVMPQLIVNDRSLELVRRVLFSTNAPIAWQSGTVAVTSEGWWIKRLHMQLNDLAFKSAGIDVAAGTAETDVTVAIERSQVIVAFGSASIASGDWLFDQDEFQRAPQPDSRWSRYVRVTLDQRRQASWRLDGVTLTWRRGKSSYATQLDAVLNRPALDIWQLSSTLRGIRPRLDVQADVAVTGDAWPFDKKSIRLASAGLTWNGPEGHGKASLASSGPGPATLDAELRAVQLVKGVRHNITATAVASRTYLDAELTLQSPNFAGAGLPLSLSPCRIKVSGELLLLRALAYEADCDAVLDSRPLVKKDFASVMPVALKIGVKAKGSLAERGGVRTLFVEPVAQLEPLSVGFWQASGSVHGNAALDVTGTPRLASLALQADLNAGIRQFGELVGWLKTTAWPMPAPFNQLRGPMDCQLKGALVLRRETNLPITCTSDLASDGQQLRSDIIAQLSLKRSESAAGSIDVGVDATINLAAVKVTLPDVQVTKPLPLLTLDKRIAVPDLPPKASKWGLSRYSLRVVTVRDGALQVVTNLVTRPVPLGIDLTVSSQAPLVGHLSINDFYLPLFRRPARIKDFLITWPEGGMPAQVAGHLVLLTPEYDVTFGVIGPLAKPRFLIDSQPPLPEQDALAVALFGGISASLEDDQQRSVEEAAAAVTSEAITLMSMYYLASTPIESVSYNPFTDSLQIKVLLEKGIVLTVGSEREEPDFGLSKRLGRNWWVETTESRSAGSSERSGQAMLRWGKRY